MYFETVPVQPLVNDEQLKLLAAALALVISTATVQINIAGFVNKVRDELNSTNEGSWDWNKTSDMYDLLWGYALGIAFNIVFFIVAIIIQEQTAPSEYAYFGRLLWWMFLINLIAWCVGAILDVLRAICFPPRPKTG